MMNQPSSTHLVTLPAPLPVPETDLPEAYPIAAPTALVITTHDALLAQANRLRVKQQHKSRWLVWTLGCALLFGSGLYVAWSVSQSPPHHASPMEEVALVTRAPLEVCVVEQGNLESSDTLEVRNHIKIPGIKLESMVPYGTKVKKGQAVAKLDLTPVQTALEEQKLKLQASQDKVRDAEEALDALRNKQESDLSSTQLQLNLSQMDLDRYMTEEKQVELNERRGAIAMAQRDLHEAEEKLEYYRTFHKRGFISSEQLKAKEAEVNRSRFSLNQNQARLKIFEKYQMPKQETQLKATVEDNRRALIRLKRNNFIAVLKAQGDVGTQKQAELVETQKLEQLQAQLKLAEVRAPRDGILTAPPVQEAGKPRLTVGSVVLPEQPIYWMPDFDQLAVNVRLEEAEALKVRPGQVVRVSFEDEDAGLVTGVVEKVDFSAEPTMGRGETQPRDFVARIKVKQHSAQPTLRLGIKTKVEIPTGLVSDALRIPVPAIAEKDGKHFAFIKRDSRIEPREIRLGGCDGKFQEVREGLEPGDKVVVHPKPKLIDFKEGEVTAKGPSFVVTP